jgi:DNA-binding CsgD family transcriptional regulator
MSMGLTNGLKQKEQILLLGRVGFQPKEIAELLGTTANTVSKELSVFRKTAIKSGAARREKTKRNQRSSKYA